MTSGAQSLAFARRRGAALRGEQDAESLALALFKRLDVSDVTGASALVAADAQVDFGPAGITGSFAEKGIPFLRTLSTAFPDLRVRVRSIMGNSNTVVVEITVEGTQSADFLGIPNQRKCIEIDQAWVLTASRGEIASIRAYWCQSQLYRRLGIRRLDQISG
jgi:predicted ester cyclase